MKFYLIDTNKDVSDALAKVFENVPEFTIINDSIFDYPCDAIVSPANSFGFMNGGIDFVISKNLGWHIEKKLQKKIREKYFGELLVGQAEIIETEHKDFPYLISAPTMRTPMTIHRSTNIYLCMKAILLLLKFGKFENGTSISEKVKTIAIPGLGTGVGQMLPIVSARSMRIAWEDIKNETFSSEKDWEKLRGNYAYFFTHDKKDIIYDIP